MAGLSRRHLLQGAAVAGGMLAVSPRSVRAQGKPDKLVYIGENQGGWKRVLMEEVGPAFEKATGIKVEFTMMPVDAWRARLKAELGAGSSGIDIAQWSSCRASPTASRRASFAEFQRVALAVNSPPERYGVGIMGKQGAGLYTSLASWLYSAGGRLVDWKTARCSSTTRGPSPLCNSWAIWW